MDWCHVLRHDGLLYEITEDRMRDKPKGGRRIQMLHDLVNDDGTCCTQTGSRAERRMETEDVSNLLYSRKTTDFTTPEILKLHYFAHWISILKSCRRAAATTLCPGPSPSFVGAVAPRAAEPTAPADGNVAVGSHAQYVSTLTAAAAWRVNAAVSKAAWWPWPFDLENGAPVMCDMGYFCDNFSLPRPPCSRLRPDVRDRQTSHSIIA